MNEIFAIGELVLVLNESYTGKILEFGKLNKVSSSFKRTYLVNIKGKDKWFNEEELTKINQVKAKEIIK